MKVFTLDTRLTAKYGAGLLLVLVLLTVLTYYSSLFYGFIFDDYPNIVKLFEIRSRGFSDLFFAHSRWVCFWLNTFYFKIARFDPFVYRLGNLIIHIVNGSLLFTLLVVLLRGLKQSSFFKLNAYPVAFLTAGLFLLHPVQTQTVCYVIQGQLEGCALLSMLLAVAAFVLLVKTTHPVGKGFFLLLLLAIGALSAGTKEIVIVAPLLLMLVDWFFIAQASWPSFRKRLWIHASYALVVLVSLCYVLKPSFFWQLLRLQVKQANNMGNILTESPHSLITPYRFFISQFKAIIHYLFIFFWPFALSADYGWKLADSFWSADSLVPFLFLCLMFAWLIRRWVYDPSSLSVFGFLWFFCALAPRASVFPSAELLADYKTYPASIGICFILACLLVHASLWVTSLFKKHLTSTKFGLQPVFWLILASLLSCGSYVAARRSKIWRCPEDFWLDAMQHGAPNKARSYNNYAVALLDRKAYKQALPYLERALELDRFYSDAWNNLAVAHGQLGDTDKAIDVLRRAIKANSSHVESYNNLAAFLISKDKYEEAKAVLHKVLALRKHYGKALFKLGQIHYFEGNIEQANTYFKQCCTQADLDTADGFSAWGMTSMQLKRFKEAVEAYSNAIRLNPADDALLNELAHAYLFNRQFGQAENLFIQLHARHPGDIEIALGLAEVYTITKRYKQALAIFKEAETDAQDHPSVLLRIAACSFKLKLYDQAEAYFKRLAAMQPTEPAASRINEALTALNQQDYSARIWSWLD